MKTTVPYIKIDNVRSVMKVNETRVSVLQTSFCFLQSPIFFPHFRPCAQGMSSKGGVTRGGDSARYDIEKGQ